MAKNGEIKAKSLTEVAQLFTQPKQIVVDQELITIMRQMVTALDNLITKENRKNHQEQQKENQDVALAFEQALVFSNSEHFKHIKPEVKSLLLEVLSRGSHFFNKKLSDPISLNDDLRNLKDRILKKIEENRNSPKSNSPNLRKKPG